MLAVANHLLDERSHGNEDLCSRLSDDDIGRLEVMLTNDGLVQNRRGEWEEPQQEISHTPFKTALEQILQICNRFHLVMRELSKRYGDREPVVVKDEYDAQYVLGGLLRVNFDDIRPESPTVEFAGKSARIDFVLKNEKIAIEVKVTRPSLSASQLTEQLLADIGLYEEHPDCDTLVCFVYDPTGLLLNPAELTELEKKSTARLSIKVAVSPG